MGSEDTDYELIVRVRAGDDRAFRVLVDRHYEGCLRYAMRMLGNRAEAEEAVQDAMLRAFGALSRYDDRGRFRSWLLRILVNRCRSRATRQRWRGTRLLQYLKGAAAQREHLVMPREPEQNDLSGSVQQALDRLSPALREAFLLKHVEELEYEEMARLTGVGISALKMRVKRAAEQLSHTLNHADDV